MKPIFFDGCFAHLHGAPAAADPQRLGVVMCGAFAQEEMCTRYGLMQLAEQLAAAGIPVLRFDYRDTNDSAEGALSLDSMREDLLRSVDVLRQEAGVGPVAVIGLRLGAVAAMHAAPGIRGLAGLALLAPIVSGKAYLREMRAAARVNPLSQLDPVPRAEDGLPLNTNGFHWSAAFQAEVEAIDLAKAVPVAVPTLVLQPRPDRAGEALLATLRTTGAEVRAEPFFGYEAFMRDPTTHLTPHDSWARIQAWLEALPAPGEAPAAADPRPVQSTLVVGDAEEVPLRFGPGGAVFGVLCRPAGGPASAVAALLVHEGSSHHAGNGGAYVRLARTLAAHGFASLRMDLRGFGDSQEDGSGRNPHYDPWRLTDVNDAIELLAANGFPRFVALGLCSGAHTALQAMLMDERAAGAIVVNLQKFIWHYGDDLRVKPRPMKRTFRSYLKSMRNPGEWRRIVKGEADLVGVAAVLALRGVDKVRNGVAAFVPPKPGSEVAVVREQMEDVTARGLAAHFLFADDDPGLGEMTTHFGAKGRRLRAVPPASMTLFDSADHHFNGSAVRRRHTDHVIEAMREIATGHGEVPPAPIVVPACEIVPPGSVQFGWRRRQVDAPVTADEAA